MAFDSLEEIIVRPGEVIIKQGEEGESSDQGRGHHPYPNPYPNPNPNPHR